MRTYEDILETVKSLGVKNPMVNKLAGGTQKELKELPKILDEGEQIYYLTPGLTDGKTWLIVCTDRRIFFLDKGYLFRFDMKEIPLERVNSIQSKKGMLLGEIHIWDGAAQTIIKNCYKKDIPPFIAAVNKAKDKLMRKGQSNTQSSLITELKELKALFEMGVITESEFVIGKQQLLKH